MRLQTGHISARECAIYPVQDGTRRSRSDGVNFDRDFRLGLAASHSNEIILARSPFDRVG